MRFKDKKHQSIYLDSKCFAQIQDIASSEKKSVNKIINELVKTGLSKRQEDILGLEQIANAIKADLQLQRDELRRQSNRIASLLHKVGLHAIANRYQTTYLHARVTDSDTAKKTADTGWNYAIEKLRERIEDDSKK